MSKMCITQMYTPVVTHYALFSPPTSANVMGSLEAHAGQPQR